MVNDLIDYIVEKGAFYTPAIPPVDMLRGEVGNCYDMATMNAVHSDKYTYVEGLAQLVETGEWVLHAWLTDGCYAFDPTWKAYKGTQEVPVPTQYLGVAIPTKLVVDFMLATQYKSVMANGWRNLELAEAMLPGFPFDIARKFNEELLELRQKQSAALK